MLSLVKDADENLNNYGVILMLDPAGDVDENVSNYGIITMLMVWVPLVNWYSMTFL